MDNLLHTKKIVSCNKKPKIRGLVSNLISNNPKSDNIPVIIRLSQPLRVTFPNHHIIITRKDAMNKYNFPTDMPSKNENILIYLPATNKPIVELKKKQTVTIKKVL